MSWSSWKKKGCIFFSVYFVRRNFFNICVLSQCIVYWINFQNIYTYYTLTYQKTLPKVLKILFYLFLKSSEVFSVSLLGFSRAKKNKIKLSWEHVASEQPPEVFCKNGVLKNFAKFTGKHLYQSLFFNKGASTGVFL